MPAQSRISPLHPELHQPGWSPARRLAFRFCFVYFGLFCLSNMAGALYPAYRVDDEVGLATLWPIRQITFWTAHHIFAATLPLVYRNSGSDDKTFDWVLVFCLLIFALLATLVRSVLDRKRTAGRLTPRPSCAWSLEEVCRP